MQIEKYDGSTEREVVTACIVNKTVLGRVASRWEGRGLCSSPWANIVVSLCVDFFKHHNDAPRKGIASLFREWAANQEDEQTILLIESYLSHLSGEYEQLEADVNAEYTINLAGSYFNRVRLTRLAESLQAHLAIGKVEDAETEMASYHRVEMGTRTGIDVLNDEEAVRSTFDQGVWEVLVEYDGAAGQFFGRLLRRGSFIVFFGREKVGKSQWLLDMAWRGCHPPNRRKVAYFQAGDLTDVELRSRIYSRLKKKPLWPQTVRYPTKIVIPPAVGGAKPEAVLTYFDKTFDTPLGFEEVWEEAKWDVEENIRSHDSHLRTLVTPNYTLTVDDIRDQLAAWRREGWSADLAVVDYADILSPPKGVKDFREGLNRNWMDLRTLSQELNLLVVTATQADAESYDRWVLTMNNFNNDKRVWSHLVAGIGINATERELEQQVYRLNKISVREAAHSMRMLWTGACLAICNPCCVSTLGAGREERT